MKPFMRVGLGVAAIGGAALLLRRAFRPIPIPGPPGNVLEIDGEQIHVVERGSGPAIVLLHGFAGNTYSWRKVIAPLSANHRVLAIDFPGFGYSDRDPGLNYSHGAHAHRVIRLLDHLGIDRATLVGHSMGGGVAQRVAEAHPERVERLVLAAAVDASEATPEHRRGGRRLLKVMGLAQRSPLFMLKAGEMGLKRSVKDASMVDREMVEGYVGPLRLPGTVEAVFSMAQSSGTDRPVNLSAIRVPTLIIAGAADRVVPPAIAMALHAGIPGSELITIADSGHLIAEENPDAFIAAVMGFLSRTTAHR